MLRPYKPGFWFLVFGLGFYAVDLDRVLYSVFKIMSATGWSAMDGAQSAAAQEVRSARACLDKVFDVPKATRRADYRRKKLLVTFRF